MNILKDRLQLLRKSMGLTQKQCAELLGVSYDSYNKWENGTSPSLDTLMKIADFYKTTTDYLLGCSSERYKSDAAFPENWGDLLLSSTKIRLLRIFEYYDKYLKQIEDENLNKVFFILLYGSNIKSANMCTSFITRLSDVKEMDYSDIEILMNDIYSKLYEFNYPSLDPNRRYSARQAYRWLLAWVEEQRPGYKDYLKKEIEEYRQRNFEEVKSSWEKRREAQTESEPTEKDNS